MSKGGEERRQTVTGTERTLKDLVLQDRSGDSSSGGEEGQCLGVRCQEEGRGQREPLRVRPFLFASRTKSPQGRLTRRVLVPTPMPLRRIETREHRTAFRTLDARLFRTHRARRRDVPLRVLHPRETLGAVRARRTLHAHSAAPSAPWAARSWSGRGWGRCGGLVVVGGVGMRRLDGGEWDRQQGGRRGRCHGGKGADALGRTDVQHDDLLILIDIHIEGVVIDIGVLAHPALCHGLF